MNSKIVFLSSASYDLNIYAGILDEITNHKTIILKLAKWFCGRHSSSYHIAKRHVLSVPLLCAD